MASHNLLLPEPVPNRRFKQSSLNKCSRYLRRLRRFNQMDFEFASWQMLYLFASPEKVFNKSIYRKRTKNQYARDDPAFLVLLAICIIMTSGALSLYLHLDYLSFFKLTFMLVLMDCILIGAIVATLSWIFANRFLRKDALSSEDVEWGYAFDVHLNAFFPPFVIIHVFLLIFFNYYVRVNWFIFRLFGNTTWLIAVTYYCYITHLGYRSLYYLKDTKFILYALVPVLLFYIITTLAGFDIMEGIIGSYNYRSGIEYF